MMLKNISHFSSRPPLYIVCVAELRRKGSNPREYKTKLSAADDYLTKFFILQNKFGRSQRRRQSCYFACLKMCHEQLANSFLPLAPRFLFCAISNSHFHQIKPIV